MFVTTANTLNILPPLLDRWKLLEYLDIQRMKKLISLIDFVTKQIKENGVKDGEMDIKDGTIKEIIRSYTRETGVRNLEREISKITRKLLRKL